MSTSYIFKKYIWLVNTILERKSITLREISEMWQRSSIGDGRPLPRSTFNRYKEDIQDIFGICIECEKRNSDYSYYISNKDEIRDGSIQRWMLNTLSVNNMLSDGVSISHRIVLEPIPSATGSLRTIIEAMKQSKELNMTYMKYVSTEPKHYVIAPYCLKLFKRRWYVVGRIRKIDQEGEKECDGLRIFSLDRIQQIEPNGQSFVMDEGFDAERYFATTFGVMHDDNVAPQRVLIRAYGREAMAIKDLPIHPSQHIVNETNDYTDFELNNISPTWDFVGYILSRSAHVKVLEPKSLIDMIVDSLNEMKMQYETEG